MKTNQVLRPFSTTTEVLKPEKRKHDIPNGIPDDIPNEADTLKSNSLFYGVITEDQFQAYSKKKLKGH